MSRDVLKCPKEPLSFRSIHVFLRVYEAWWCGDGGAGQVTKYITTHCLWLSTAHFKARRVEVVEISLAGQRYANLPKRTVRNSTKSLTCSTGWEAPGWTAHHGSVFQTYEGGGKDRKMKQELSQTHSLLDFACKTAVQPVYLFNRLSSQRIKHCGGC